MTTRNILKDISSYKHTHIIKCMFNNMQSIFSDLFFQYGSVLWYTQGIHNLSKSLHIICGWNKFSIFSKKGIKSIN